MGITMIVTGAFRETGASFFFIPKGALTHHLPTGQAVVSLPSVGPCALRGGLRSLRRAPDNAAEPAGVGHHCLYGWQIGLRPVCSSAANCCPLSGQPAIRLRKPATAQGTPFGCGSFIAVMDDASPAPSIFFCPDKRNKSAHCGEQKGRDPLWRSIIWKRRS